ncbi:hypothetical protein SDC9_184275 [bioreactor metagenome]|uniref:Uncharacterized protein n=1 Tax=bioreactor metagenome TaxID=1076179 RepID=A0A645HKV1_9ZZZZ
MGIHQLVTDHQPVLFRRKHNLLGKDNTTYAVNSFWNAITVKFADVFMPFGTVVVVVVFMNS